MSGNYGIIINKKVTIQFYCHFVQWFIKTGRESPELASAATHTRVSIYLEVVRDQKSNCSNHVEAKSGPESASLLGVSPKL